MFLAILEFYKYDAQAGGVAGAQILFCGAGGPICRGVATDNKSLSGDGSITASTSYASDLAAASSQASL